MIPGEYREFVLDNGLRVAMQRTPTQTIAGTLTVYHGSVHEREGEEGMAHFLEHTLCAGTEKYSPERVLQTMATFGFSNAFTSFDRTLFPTDMLTEDLASWVDLVSDIVARPSFERQAVEAERSRVVRELSEAKSELMPEADRAFWTALYGPDAPFFREVLGRIDIVKGASAANLSAFHKRGYVGGNMNLVLVGGIPEDAEQIVREGFAKVPSGKGEPYRYPANLSLNGKTLLEFTGHDLYNAERPAESNAELRIGLYAPYESHPDGAAAEVLGEILGAGMYSRLFRRVGRGEGNYNISGRYFGGDNQAIFTIRGLVQATKVPESLDSIFGVMQELRTSEVDEGEFDIVKRRYKYGLVKNAETNAGYAHLITKRLEGGADLNEIVRAINEVCAADVLDAARKYLPASREEGNYVQLVRMPPKDTPDWHGAHS